MKGFDIFGGLLQNTQQFFIHVADCRVPFLGRHFQGRQVGPVKAAAVVVEGRVTPAPHVGKDFPHHGGDIYLRLYTGEDLISGDLAILINAHHFSFSSRWATRWATASPMARIASV